MNRTYHVLQTAHYLRITNISQVQEIRWEKQGLKDKQQVWTEFVFIIIILFQDTVHKFLCEEIVKGLETTQN